MSEAPESLSGFEKPFYVIVSAMGVILFALAAFTVDMAVENDSRLDRIEETRFTQEDALRMEKRISEQMRDGFDDVKKCIRANDVSCD